MTYAEVKCKRCGQAHQIPSIAVPFTWWVCLPMGRCGKINEIKVWPFTR